MDYVKVTSSQIDSVGFGEGVYGPETLGVIFLPSKRQAAAGLPGGKYHYGNVTPLMHQTMMHSDSVYGYFAKFIKPSQDYPFTKIESDPMSASTHAPIADAEIPVETQSNGAESTTDNQSTALALIDTMDDDLLFTPGNVTDAQLETMRLDWLAEAKKYDITTDKSRTALKRFARPLQKLRTGIEARAKELTGATKRKIAAIDAEKRRLVQSVGGIEQEVLAPLTAWEQEEDARTVRLAGIVKSIGDKGQTYIYPDIPSIEAAIAELEAFDLSTMQEFKVSAESALTAVLKVLKPELERRKVAEAERLELDRLRAESAARADADRIEAAAKKLSDAKIQAAVDAAKVETRHEVVAELQSQNHNDPDSDSNQGHGDPEIFPEPEPGTIEQAEETLTERVSRFNHEALLALRNYNDYDDMLEAIAAGLIPHVTINYEA